MLRHESDGRGKQTEGSQSEGASVVVVKKGRGRPRKVYRLQRMQYFYVVSTVAVLFVMYTVFCMKCRQ